MDRVVMDGVRSDGVSAVAGSPDRQRKQGIIVRCPSERDIAGLAKHFSEMQKHYNCPVSDAEAVKAATLACQPPVNTFDPRVLIALKGDVIVGSLVMNVTFPAFKLTLSLYIRDL